MLVRRLILASSLALLVVCAPQCVFLEAHADTGRSEDFGFSGGPSENQIISQTYTILISTTSSNMDYIDVELEEGSTWISIANITNSPWLEQWDTTAHSDGDYKLRIRGTYDNGTSTNWIESATFTLDNTNPSGLSIDVADAEIGDGSSTINRAWFKTEDTGTLTFNWSATDAHISHATLTNVPGTGTPAQDGPGTLLNQWDWSPGDLDEGTWASVLTVYDEGGLSSQSTIHLGIDRTGPTVGTPALSESSGSWTSSSTLHVTGLGNGATDSGGSGIASYHVRDSADEWTDIGVGGSTTMPLDEGIRTIQFRAIDKLGNTGNPLDVTIKVDRTAPIAGGWIIPDLTDSLYGEVPITVDATDMHSGIDDSASTLQYGFDSDGLGSTPDLSTTWFEIGTGTSGTISSSIDWSTKAGQYLSLRAVLKDVAGNTVTTQPSHFQILPGLDFEISEPSLNRLVVRAGQNDPVHVEAKLTTSQAYIGSVIVEIQSAPANRDSMTEWTTLETITTGTGELIDKEFQISSNISLTSSGEYDLRIIVDPSNGVAENDEGNNEVFLLVSAADPTVVNTVAGFAPDVLLILLAGLFASYLLRRREAAS